MIIPASAVVPTKDRATALKRTLDSLSVQSNLPAELILIDGSAGDDSRALSKEWAATVAPHTTVEWRRADRLGAAAQRNQGVAIAVRATIMPTDPRPEIRADKKPSKRIATNTNVAAKIRADITLGEINK